MTDPDAARSRSVGPDDYLPDVVSCRECWRMWIALAGAAGWLAGLACGIMWS